MNRAPIESKVYAALIGGSVGAVASKFLLWVIGVVFFGVVASAGTATDAIAAVPSPVADVVSGVVTLGAVALGGYMARHTPRPDLPALPPSAGTGPEPLAPEEPAQALPEPPLVVDVDADGRDDRTGRFVPGH